MISGERGGVRLGQGAVERGGACMYGNVNEDGGDEKVCGWRWVIIQLWCASKLQEVSLATWPW